MKSITLFYINERDQTILPLLLPTVAVNNNCRAEMQDQRSSGNYGHSMLPHDVDPDFLENARLKLLYDLDIFDTEPEAAFDTLTALAAKLCGKPISLVSLVDSHRQFFKSRFGATMTETPRTDSFCSHAIATLDTDGGLFEVPDTHQDDRFSSNPLVISEPQIRHYAAVPLRPTGDVAVGTLCVISPDAGRLNEQERRTLSELGAVAEELLRLRLIAKMEAQARDRADRSEKHYRYLADNTADVVFIHDINLVTRYMSPNAPGFLGYTHEEAAEFKSTRELFHEDDIERLIETLLGLTPEEPTVWFRIRAMNKDGTIRHISAHTTAIFVGEAIQEYQTAARNIDIVIEYERELQDANIRLVALDEQRSALMRGITHDLAAPVAAMRITIESLRSQLTDPAMINQGDRLQEFAKSVEAFVSDLRNLGEPEGSSYSLDLREIDARKVIELAIAQVPHIPGSDLSVDLDDITAFADTHALSRITTNLLTNAHRHTPAGTPITVSLTVEDKMVLLKVADRGPGIDATVRTRVFEPYVSTDPDRTGIGLSITKALAEAQDGVVSIEANHPKGTVVSVRLPLTSSPEGEPGTPDVVLG